MQLDQMSLLQERINKVVLLTRKLKEENDDLKHKLSEAQEKLRELETSDLASRFDTEEKQKALSDAIRLLDSMLVDSDDDFLPSDQDKALRYLAGEEEG
jgi:hypothetical protein